MLQCVPPCACAKSTAGRWVKYIFRLSLNKSFSYHFTPSYSKAGQVETTTNVIGPQWVHWETESNLYCGGILLTMPTSPFTKEGLVSYALQNSDKAVS